MQIRSVATIDLWMGTGEDEGNDHRLRPTLMSHYHFSEFLFFFFFFFVFFLISIGLKSHTTFELFELVREINLTENSPVDLERLILNTGQISLLFFCPPWLILFRKS